MGDPFGGRFGGFRGSLFGGRDPFDDPFFSRPFDDPFFSRPFEDPFFSRPFEDLLQPPNSFSSGASFSNNAQNNYGGRRGLTIEELPSDEEVEERKGFRSNEEERTSSVDQPYVEHPEDDSDAERKIQNVKNQRSDFNRREGTQSRVFKHHTSKVTYGGIDGAYYTSSRTRRKGSDGMVIEESKEADKTTGEATHKISRGINDKGHSVTRKLNSSGGVESTQTLHNLEEEELSGFEEAWKGNSSLTKHESSGFDQCFGGWLLPSLDQTRRRTDQTRTSAPPRAKKVVRINIE